MREQSTKVLFDGLIAILRPIVRFCLRRSLKLQDLIEASKIAFISVAKEEMLKEDIESSASKLSIMTGVHRRDIARLEGSNEPKQESKLLGKILNMWRENKEYLSPNGRPRALSVEGKNSEFATLVHSISKDLNPYTVLFELERSAVIERVKDSIRLTSSIYAPIGNIKEGLNLLSSDLEDLVLAVDQNIFDKDQIPNLHIKTDYDNICLENMPEIEKWLLNAGTEQHHKISKYLAQFDQDLQPKLKNKAAGGRVAFGTFSLSSLPKK